VVSRTSAAVTLRDLADGTLTDGKQFSERFAGRNNTTALL
jgi:hypothetical protein